MNDLPDKAADEAKEPNVRRRRLVLYGLAGMALLVIAFFAVRTLAGGDDEPKTSNRPQPPLIVERFKLTAARGQKGRGIAELVDHGNRQGLRVLAVELQPSEESQVYQLVLAGGSEEPKLLGNQAVGDSKTFVGEARTTSEELHKYRRIELRRVTDANPPIDDLVLRGAIPR